MIQTVVCDLDGSLMPGGGGLYVKDEIAERLIALEEKGVLLILNSARIIQGVYPLARQLKMNEYGGYIISCNGVHVMDMKTEKTLLEYPLTKDEANIVWKATRKYDLQVMFTQPEYSVANAWTKGFENDWQACHIDYLLSFQAEKYMKDVIWKMGISDTKEKLDQYFDAVKQDISKQSNVQVIRANDFICDVISIKADKAKTLDTLLKMNHLIWKETSVIGDTDADAKSIEQAGFGVTLENGSDLCKKNADFLVPSCYEDGCLVWLKQLMKMI